MSLHFPSRPGARLYPGTCNLKVAMPLLGYRPYQIRRMLLAPECPVRWGVRDAAPRLDMGDIMAYRERQRLATRTPAQRFPRLWEETRGR